jgi:hypothetical protein
MDNPIRDFWSWRMPSYDAPKGRDEKQQSDPSFSLAQANADLGKLAASAFTDVRRAFINALDFDNPASEARVLLQGDPLAGRLVREFLDRARDYDEAMRDALRPILQDRTDYFYRLQLIEHWEKHHRTPHSGRWIRVGSETRLAPS